MCAACVRACMASERAIVCVCVSERQRKKAYEFCICIVFVADGILVSVAHDDQVPRCHSA